MQNKSGSCCGSTTTDLQMLALRYPIGILGASDVIYNLIPDTLNLLLDNRSQVVCNNQLWKIWAKKMHPFVKKLSKKNAHSKPVTFVYESMLQDSKFFCYTLSLS
jgi:hypothetical protein